ASPGYIRNQITNTRTLAFAFFPSSSFCAHRAPATHVGHVGDSSRIRRGCPLYALNHPLISSMPRSCDSPDAAGSDRGIANSANAMTTAAAVRIDLTMLPSDCSRGTLTPDPDQRPV